MRNFAKSAANTNNGTMEYTSTHIPLCVIKHLNHHLNDNKLIDKLPLTLNNEILSMNCMLSHDLREFEQNYSKVRQEFKSEIYSKVITKYHEEMWWDAYDKGDEECLEEFLRPRVKVNSKSSFSEVYGDITESIRDDDYDNDNFMNHFINYNKTVEELICIHYYSIQNFYDSRIYYKNVFTSSIDVLYSNDIPNPMSTDFSESDVKGDRDEFINELDEIVEERRLWYIKYNKKCRKQGMFKRYYSKRTKKREPALISSNKVVMMKLDKK